MHIGENIQIISSPVFEQLSSMFVFQCHMNNSNQLSIEQQKWVEEKSRVIPQTIKDELQVFFSKESFIGLSMIRYAYEKKCFQSISEFITQLEMEPAHTIFYHFLQTGFTPDEVEDINNLEEVSFFIKQTSLPESEKWKLTFLYVDIENTKQRFLSLLKQYFEFYFKDDLPFFMEKQQENLKLLDEKSIFLTRERIGEAFPNIPSYIIEHKEIKLILSPSFFYDISSLCSENDHSFIYHFGINEYDSMTKKKMTQDDVLDAIKIVADEKRIKIIKLLNKAPRYGYELANTLGLSNSTISHHLSTLSSIGIVFSIRLENKVYYQLDKEKLQAIMEALTNSLLE